MGRSWIEVVAVVGLEVAIAALPVAAQIEADETLGAERSRLTRDAILRRRADRAGTRADLIEGGAQRGRNLFHSFDQFNVNDGQRVYFDNPDGVNNIFGRVTGTDVSDIFGTLGVDGTADLFLLNPNGILFGPNARLDVNGSFVGSTANAVQFGDQGFFRASDASAPPLLTVDPSAFLFNQINPNARIVNQSVTPLRFNNRNGIAVGLEVPFGRSLLLLGSDVTLEGGSGVNAFGGRVELGGLSSPGTVGLSGGDQLQLAFPSNVARADVALRDGATVDVVADNGGDVAVNARNVELVDGSNIFAGIGIGLGFPGAQAGDVDINASGILTLANSSFIQSSVFGGAIGDSGDVRISGQSINLLNGSGLGSAVVGQGRSGEVRVEAADTITLAGQDAIGTGSVILSLVAQLEGFVGSGEGSDINLQARSLVMADGAQIGTTNLNAVGDAGDVRINLTDSLLMQGDRTAIQAGTAGEGNGGDIFVTAGNTVDLRSGARFLTITRGTGNAGNVTVTAGNSVVFDGVSTDYDFDGFNDRSGINSSVQFGGNNSRQAGAITVNTGRFTISNSAGILSNIEAGAIGTGAGVTINANSMQMLNGGQIQSLLRQSEPDANGVPLAPAQGAAGNININLTGDFIANSFVDNDPNVLGSRSEIFSSVGDGTVGDAGDISLRARNITLQSGSRIVSDTFGTGNSGSVTIQATDQVLFDGTFPNPQGGDPFRSGVFSSINRNPELALGLSDQRIAGDVNVNAGSFVLRRGGSLYANVEQGAIGQGGDINITGGSLLIQDGSQIQSILRSEGRDILGARGRTGDVNVTLTGSYTADGEENNRFSSGILTSVEAGTEGNAGNITVQARSIELTNGARFVTETQGQGNAGRVTIGATDSIRFDGFGSERSGISSSVKPANGDPVGRVAGDVVITRGNFTISNGAAILTNVEAGANGTGGNIVINANNMSVLNSAFIQALLRGAEGNTAGATGATGNVDINLTGDFVARGINPLEPDSNEITTSAGLDTRGNAGNISIDARSVRLFNGSRLVTETAGQGNAGAVTITADGVILFDGINTLDPGGRTQSGLASSVFAASGAQGNRRAGDIRINNGAVRLSNGATIFANVEAGAVGRGGDIIIDAKSLALRNSGQLQAFLRGAEETNGGAQGRPGTIVLQLEKNFTARGVGETGLSNALFTSVGRNTIGNAGDIRIEARSIQLQDGSRLVTETEGQGNAGRVIVRADRSIRFDGINRDFPSGIASSVFVAENATGFRRAGDIQISTGDFRVINNAIIFSNVEAGAVGRSGNILIDANSMALVEGGQIQSILRGTDLSNNLAGARGATGLVNIDLGQGTLDIQGIGNNASAIFTFVQPGTSGDAGRVVVRAGAINIEDTGIISSSTSGDGDGGRLDLNAEDAITVRNGGDIQTEATEFSSGQAGAVQLNTRQLRVEGAGSSVSATSQFTGGGNIIINAEEVTIRDTIQTTPAGASQDGILASSQLGRGGRITFSRRLETLQIDNGSVSASTQTGEAGSLTVQAADQVWLTNSAVLSVAANGGGGGSGDIDVNTRALRVDNGSRISASTISRRSDLSNGADNRSNANRGSGNITLRNLETLEVENGVISASTRSGQAGTLIVDAAEGSVELRNRGRLRVAASEAGGDAGALEITTNRFLAEDSTASVSSAAGQAGNLTVDAAAVQLENGRLTARTAETGANISLQNVEQLYMRNGSQISAPASEFATGGNVTLDNADGFTVAVPGEDSDIIADATLGQGGNITIDTLGIYNFQVGPDQPITNDIDASSQFNRQGSVNINTPDTDPSRGLIELPSGVVDASQQIDRTCRASETDEFGEFVVTGRGGLPPNPNEVLDSNALDDPATDWVTPENTFENPSNQNIDQSESQSSVSLPTPNAQSSDSNSIDSNSIVEAQGWMVGADGKVMLVAQAPDHTAPIPNSVQCP